MHRLVCIISDTHGQLDERIAERASHCDIAVHAGDIGNAAVSTVREMLLGLVGGFKDVAGAALPKARSGDVDEGASTH